ncbi:uncharacterized protein METZ01_LOCUS383709 [marine metagenome]|uniref:Uncharacterized protein n=1 Tax=marine metagenome TaxID=408172 RepID=A0A382UAE9_9ZZZZ
MANLDLFGKKAKQTITEKRLKTKTAFPFLSSQTSPN